MRHIPNAETRLLVAGNCRTALIPWSGFSWPDAHIPRTEKPVRFVGTDRAWGLLGVPFTYRPETPCPKCGIVRFPA